MHAGKGTVDDADGGAGFEALRGDFEVFGAGDGQAETVDDVLPHLGQYPGEVHIFQGSCNVKRRDTLALIHMHEEVAREQRHDDFLLPVAPDPHLLPQRQEVLDALLRQLGLYFFLPTWSDVEDSPFAGKG